MRTDLALHYHVDGNDIGYVTRTLVAAWAIAARDADKLRERGYRVVGQHGDYDAEHGETTYVIRTVPCMERACLKLVDDSERWWVEDSETGDLHMPGWEPPARQRQKRRPSPAPGTRKTRFIAKAQVPNTNTFRRLELVAPGKEQALAMFQNILARGGGYVLKMMYELRAGAEHLVWREEQGYV